MPKKNLQLSKDQLRLSATMLVLVLLSALILAAWTVFLRNISPLSPGSFQPLSDPEDGILVEEEIGDLPDNPELFLQSSPDGKAFAYIEEKDGKRRVIINGEQGPYHDSITSMSFSPDGKNFAYTAKDDNKEFAVINGVEGKPYDWIFEPRLFSPDSRYFIYKARDSRGDMIVVNGRESRAYQRIFGLQLAEDKETISFFARNGKELWRGAIRLEDVTE